MSVYAVSDLHGYFSLYKQIKTFLKPNDIVYCLGDCGDRGPNSWATIKAIYNDPQFIYLKGNHEDLLAFAMCEYIEDYKTLWQECPYITPLEDCMDNGGTSTLMEWMNDGMEAKWAAILKNLPFYTTYTNTNGTDCILTHAGYTPGKESINDYTEYLWDRKHFDDNWDSDKDILIVHGHTPCALIDPGWKVSDKAIWYSHGRKVCIDMGTYSTYTALLLNLDTFDEHIFSTTNIDDSFETFKNK